MPSYFASGNYATTNGTASAYRLDIEARTSEVAGGTMVEIAAVVTMTRNPGVPAFGSGGLRSWSLPGGRNTNTGGPADASGNSTFVYDFAVTNPTQVYNYFNRYVPYSYGASTTLTVTVASGSSSSFFTSRTLSVNVPLFQQATEAAPDAFTNIPYVSGTVGNSYSDIVYSFGTTVNITRTGTLPPGLTGTYEGQGYRVQGTPTTAGTYSFTLTAANSTGGTRSYGASITIAAPPPPPPPITTPNVIGRTESSARTTLTNAGFGTVTTTFNTSGATSLNNLIVFNQLPAANTLVADGSSASISVYDYRLVVPNLSGRTQSEAIALINNAGFSLYTSTLSTTSATLANNLTVRTQSPSAGSTLNVNNSISFTLYDYRVSVPNVVQQLQDTAIANLSNAGFKTVTITLTQTGATAQNVGTVRTQTPVNNATTYNPANTSVSLQVYSLGITGKRYTGTGFSALTTVRRYTGSAWTTLTVQKRFNGTAWIDIAN